MSKMVFELAAWFLHQVKVKAGKWYTNNSDLPMCNKITIYMYCVAVHDLPHMYCYTIQVDCWFFTNVFEASHKMVDFLSQCIVAKCSQIKMILQECNPFEHASLITRRERKQRQEK